MSIFNPSSVSPSGHDLLPQRIIRRTPVNIPYGVVHGHDRCGEVEGVSASSTDRADCPISDRESLAVLVVEDDPEHARELEQALRSSGGFRSVEIRVARTLTDAMTSLRSGRFDLILLDLDLSDSLGLQTFQRLFMGSVTTPIIVVTDALDEEKGVQAVRMGAYDYLVRQQLDGKSLLRSILRALDRRKLEESLRLKDIAVESSIGGIVVADMSGEITYVNRAAVRLMGYGQRSEVLGKDLSSFFGADERTKGEIARLQDAEIWVGGTVGRSRDGTPVHLDMALNVVCDFAGNPVCLVSSFTDATRRRRAEEQVRHCAMESDAARNRAEAYFDILAHDVTNLISPMMVHAELIALQGDLPSDARESAAKLVMQARRTANFILSFRMLQEAASCSPKDMAVLDVREIAPLIEEAVAHDFPDKKVKLSVQSPRDADILVPGAEFLERIIFGLVDNAARNARAQEVNIELIAEPCERKEGRVSWRIEVVDDGPGIPDAEKRSLMAPFEMSRSLIRASPTTLMFYSAILRHINGCLRIEDRIPGSLGLGTRVVIEVPGAVGVRSQGMPKI